MDPVEIGAVIGLARRRFQNFSEAADSLLGTLSAIVPGVLVLGRLDRDEQIHYVIEVSGGGLARISRGAALVPAEAGVSPDSMRSLGAADWISAPLERTDGRIAGILCAVSPEADVYVPEHAALLGVAARLLGHEWESVQLRSELRRLRSQVNAGPSTDADTSLPDRDGFVDLLSAEAQAVAEEAVSSVLVVCRIAASDSSTEAIGPADRLAVKLAADVLAGTIRGADKVGRIDDLALGAILVNCGVEDTPAFVARLLAALDRVNNGSRARIDVTCGVQPLGAGLSAAEVLSLAEAAALEPAGSPEANLAPQTGR
jgi:GGDEF domain-containing protein